MQFLIGNIIHCLFSNHFRWILCFKILSCQAVTDVKMFKQKPTSIVKIDVHANVLICFVEDRLLLENWFTYYFLLINQFNLSRKSAHFFNSYSCNSTHLSQLHEHFVFHFYLLSLLLTSIYREFISFASSL